MTDYESLGFNSTHITAKGYIRGVHVPSGRQRMVHDVVWEINFGPIPEGFDVHHKDENKQNNAIENLEILSPLNHKRFHSGCIKNDQGEWLKPCNQCGEFKLLSEYYWAGHGRWPMSQCKKCHIKNMVIAKRLRKNKQRLLKQDLA